VPEVVGQLAQGLQVHPAQRAPVTPEPLWLSHLLEAIDAGHDDLCGFHRQANRYVTMRGRSSHAVARRLG
jgi:hypothetical protein